MFPFGSLANDEFLGLRDFDLPSFIDSAPSFEITSTLMDLPNLSYYDIDEHMPQKIDSRYFNLPGFSSLQLSCTDFSILHTNVRSLSVHHDELVSLSVHTNLNPKVIGVSEICTLWTIPYRQILIFLVITFLRLFTHSEWWFWFVH